MSSSSSSSNSKPVLKAKRGGGLQGRRPQPLSLPTASSSAAARPYKKPRVSDVVGRPGPVIIYERTPKAVHVRPDEFMAVVQRLTGQQAVVLPQIGMAPVVSPPEEAANQYKVLMLLGQQEAPPLDNLPAAVLHSPGLASDGFLLSPGIFLFSPATKQALHEMIS